MGADTPRDMLSAGASADRRARLNLWVASRWSLRDGSLQSMRWRRFIEIAIGRVLPEMASPGQTSTSLQAPQYIDSPEGLRGCPATAHLTPGREIHGRQPGAGRSGQGQDQGRAKVRLQPRLDHSQG